MKKILVLGSNGMAGHVLMEYFKDKNEYELFGLVEENFSSSNYDFEKQIKKYEPNIIINALRLVVQECEDHPKRAIFIIITIHLHNTLISFLNNSAIVLSYN